MFWKYKRKLQYWMFERAASGVLQTPPMPVTPGLCTVVSMVAKRDVLMYLVSMKAFYRRLGGGRIVAIVDRDTPRASLDTLSHHLPGIEFQILEDIGVGPCQRGGTWERIIHIIDRTDRGEYVVQIDSDVMPTGEDISEVLRCIEQRTAFTMADHAKIVPAKVAAEFARGLQGNYIGNLAEALMDQLPGAETLSYVRGSSGLAGFAPGGFSRRQLDEYHVEMEKLVGEKRWREWGTEQCASNFAVANTPGAITLPYPAYCSFHPGGERDAAKMYHFIGSFRFDEGRFIALARQEIATLKAPAKRVPLAA
jgi:hypothetical protein